MWKPTFLLSCGCAGVALPAHALTLTPVDSDSGGPFALTQNHYHECPGAKKNKEVSVYGRGHDCIAAQRMGWLGVHGNTTFIDIKSASLALHTCNIFQVPPICCCYGKPRLLFLPKRQWLIHIHILTFTHTIAIIKNVPHHHMTLLLITFLIWAYNSKPRILFPAGKLQFHNCVEACKTLVEYGQGDPRCLFYCAIL